MRREGADDGNRRRIGTSSSGEKPKAPLERVDGGQERAQSLALFTKDTG